MSRATHARARCGPRGVEARTAAPANYQWSAMKHAAVVLKLLGLVAAQRSATVHEVQPLVRDRVHALWLNGPTFSGKVSGGTWPNFHGYGRKARLPLRCYPKARATSSGRPTLTVILEPMR